MSAGGKQSVLRVAPVRSGLERFGRLIFSIPREDMPPVYLTPEEQIRICQEHMLPAFTCERIIIAQRRGWGDAFADHELLRTLEKAAATDLRQAGAAFKREFTGQAPDEIRKGAPGNSPMLQDFIWALGVLSAWELRERDLLRMDGMRFVRAPVYNLTARLLGPRVSADTVRRAYEAAAPRVAELTVIAEWEDGPAEIPEIQWLMRRLTADLSLRRLLSIGRDFIRAEIARGKARDFPAFRAALLTGRFATQSATEGSR